MNATMRARRMAAGSKPRTTDWSREMEAGSGRGQGVKAKQPKPATTIKQAVERGRQGTDLSSTGRRP